MRVDRIIPNWFIHNKWAKKVGIKEEIANLVNRALDYGFNWMMYEKKGVDDEKNYDNLIYQQLKFFFEKEKAKKGYIKALYLHHLLDFFKETYVDIYDIELVFRKFLQDKVIIEITDSEGNEINFQEEIEDLFTLLRENKEDLYIDLKGKSIDNFG